MTDLDAIRECSVPRLSKLTRRFAARLKPTWGFVLYGILYVDGSLIPPRSGG